MRMLHIFIAVGLLAIFLRTDVQLVDIPLNMPLVWQGGGALLLIGLLLGRFSARWPTPGNTFRMAGWGLFVVIVLGLVEYSTEWRQTGLIRENQTVVLSAASVEKVNSQIIRARDGLFRSKAQANGVNFDVLIDSGASLVLLRYQDAENMGVDMAALTFTTPVLAASGALNIAPIVLNQLSIGPITLFNVQAAVAPKGQSQTSLLGASFLSRLDEVTQKGDTMILRARSKK